MSMVFKQSLGTSFVVRIVLSHSEVKFDASPTVALVLCDKHLLTHECCYVSCGNALRSQDRICIT
jgi:hypothetical protein